MKRFETFLKASVDVPRYELWAMEFALWVFFLVGVYKLVTN